ncbi:MAG: DoxX family membrane protein [Chloroflexi bacterium]|nr:DoxX family membrane protein [Chloroflexota bacterium]
MFAVKHVTDESGNVIIQDPPIARFLFSSSKVALLWLVLRVYVAWDWLEAGWHKFTDPAWMVTGDGIMGFWTRALAVNNGKPVITYDWYRNFIQYLVDSGSQVWFAKLIVLGEIAVGLGLLFGALVGVAAFFGSVMNMSFMLAGTVSTNPVLFGAEVLLILAWKNAGYLGIDRYLLPLLGTPWKQPKLETSQARPVAVRAA